MIRYVNHDSLLSSLFLVSFSRHLPSFSIFLPPNHSFSRLREEMVDFLSFRLTLSPSLPLYFSHLLLLSHSHSSDLNKQNNRPNSPYFTIISSPFLPLVHFNSYSIILASLSPSYILLLSSSNIMTINRRD